MKSLSDERYLDQYCDEDVCPCWFSKNYSLRALAATRLFAANVDEQLIKLKTDHTSDAVRSYKRVSDEQLSCMTDVISSNCLKETDADESENGVNVASALINNCNLTGCSLKINAVARHCYVRSLNCLLV